MIDARPASSPSPPPALSRLLRALPIACALALSVGGAAAANPTGAAQGAAADARVAPPASAPAPATAAVPSPTTPAPAAAEPPPATVLLLLPSPASPFARAADAVRQGFLAAQAVSSQPMTVRVLEVDDELKTLPRVLATARAQGVDVIAGPLPRAQVNAIMKAELSVPMVTLSLPDTDALAPAPMLVFGLSVEQEARALVRAALATLAPPRAGAPTRITPRFVLLSGEGALARRAAVAFRDALREAGERVSPIAVDLRLEALQTIGDRVFRAEPDAVFLALDAREAAIVRPRLTHDLRLFATSQVHLGGAEGVLLAHDLDGVHFVDTPWLLEVDHPAVMVHAQPAQPLSAELGRLYALGIDAYRLADQWRAGRARFELDGVTGALHVDRAARARVERWPAFAVYRNGRVERLHVPPPAAWP